MEADRRLSGPASRSGPAARPQAELLAPAGGPPALQAALSAGADAVYLGLDAWSARAFAGNFEPAALLAAIDRAHLFGARVHLALNVLLKDDELEPALAALEAPYRAGLDALIVADLGFAALVHEAYPELELHASTQLDTHSSAQLEGLARLGFARAILARELSLDEIAALDSHGLALEAFVHGALCYGYSGACLLSSMASGRSGNRGRCSQACRMRYRLAAGASGSSATAELRRVPVDRPDLAAVAALPALLAAGVTSFKIEGRMKDPAYVAVTTAVYREALDAALADHERFTVLPHWLSRLEQSFSRGFTSAHLEGHHAAVRAGGRGGHRGVQVGRVEAVDEAGGKVTVRVDPELHEADVLQIYTVWGSTQPARLAALLAGGRPGDERLVLRLSERVSVKDRVFRTSSGQIDAFAADALAGRTLARPIALSAVLDGRRGERPRLLLRAAGKEATVEGGAPLEAARTAALSVDKARRAVAALGGTPYELRDFEFSVDDGVFLGVGDLKALRRAALAKLDERRLAGGRRAAPAARPPAAAPWPAAAPRPAGDSAIAVAGAAPESAGRALPAIVLRLRPGEEPVTLERVGALCLDLRAGDDLELVAAARAAARRSGLAVRVRSPEILFDGDRAWAAAVAAMGWDAVYARHVAALTWADTVVLEYPLQGLSSGNAALLGASGVVCPPELSLDELGRWPSPAVAAGVASATATALAQTAPTGPARATAPVVEALVFGREQVLVSRDTLGLEEGLGAAPSEDGPAQDVGAAPFMGAPAPTLALTLTDARGYAFPVLVAPGETRIFNSRVTNLCGRVTELVAAGVRGLIVAQADLDGDERRAFARAGLHGLAAFDDRERFTTGHLFRGVA